MKFRLFTNKSKSVGSGKENVLSLMGAKEF